MHLLGLGPGQGAGDETGARVRGGYRPLLRGTGQSQRATERIRVQTGVLDMMITHQGEI